MLPPAIGLALLAAAAVAAETQPITIPLVRNHDGYGARIRRSSLEKRQAAAATEHVYNSDGREFLIEVAIGTPAQKFNVTLDTGSATLWVPSTECSMLDCPYGRYNASASTSVQRTNSTFQIQYGIGMANGTYVREAVTVAGLTIPSQIVGLANETQDIYGGMTEGYSNGIMGFGFPGMNALRGYSDDVPFVFNLANNNLIPEAVFSVYLNSQFSYGYSGEITLGGIDSTKYTGSLTYAPVASYTLGTSTGQVVQDVYIYWTLGGIGIQTSTGFNADFDEIKGFILDTGSTMTYGPKDITDQIAQSITGNSAQQIYDVFNGMYRADCKLAARSDSITFLAATNAQSPTSNPLNITVPIREMIVPYNAHTPEEAQECFLGIAPMPGSLSWESPIEYVLGESVLRSFYVVHDMVKRRVGIAPAAFLQGPAGGSNGDGDKPGESAASSNLIRSLRSAFMTAAFISGINFLF